MLLLELLQTGNVLADNVIFNVDDRSDADVLEVGVLHSVGDDGHLESITGGMADGEGDTIDGDAALVDRKVSVTGHLWVVIVLEGEVSGAIGIFHSGATGCLVNVSLDDVPVESSVHQHGTFNVDLVANME